MATTMQSRKRTISSEFPDFGELDVKLPEGFFDTSWHNDVMPSFTRELVDGRCIVIWIDFADEDMRESDGPRFASVLRDSSDTTIDEFTSDEWQKIIDWTSAAAASQG